MNAIKKGDFSVKNYTISILFTTLFTFFISIPVLGSTLITAPIDSRPISVEYLENLTSLAGDEFFTVDKKVLDYFSDNSSKNRFANSKEVRKQIEELVKKNNSENTTVLINTSTYITGGLVGSRCASNYDDYESALSDFHSLLTNYPKPTYYVNLAMPRNLPETRNNIIWPNDEKIRGLGYYYLKYNKDSDTKDYISKKFYRVTPTQMLMEWGYTKNKKEELGQNSLTPWEKEYLEHIESTYQHSTTYGSYLEAYQIPFEKTAALFESLLRWQKNGLLDEIIIGNDDFQLPDFINYMYKNSKETNWIPMENGSPIKFSFSRTYMTSGKNSIYNRLETMYGTQAAEKSMNGEHDKINFIFGMDEIPQLIYARDLSKRKQLTTRFDIAIFGESQKIADYDVLNAQSLLNNAINFTKSAENKTDSLFSLYLADYNGIQKDEIQKIVSQMNDSYENNSVGLIELYSSDVLNNGTNAILQNLLSKNGDKTGISAVQLACYSAWNTNANAIGLGVAHAQVYGITKQFDVTPSFLESQIKILGQHILEDGSYILHTKRQLNREGFQPQNKDTLISTSLYDILQPEPLMNAFKGESYSIGNQIYQVDSCSLFDYNFPWGRLFDCYLELKVQVSAL